MVGHRGDRAVQQLDQGKEEIEQFVYIGCEVDTSRGVPKLWYCAIKIKIRGTILGGEMV